jgi:pimeloyl-ACP methyl ester carboxylesterase
MRDLPSDVSFYSADLPGCGSSPVPRAWTMKAIAGEVADAIRWIGEPVTLVGHCSGANIGFFAAQMTPRLVCRIVAIDAFAFWPWYFRVFVNRAIGRYAYYCTFANPVGRWATNLSMSGKRTGDTHLTEGFSRVDHAVTYRYLEMLRDAGGIEQLRGLTPEIDLAYGARSFASVRESARRMAALWPQARVIRLAGAGHLPIREATAALRGLIFEKPVFDRLMPCLN